MTEMENSNTTVNADNNYYIGFDIGTNSVGYATTTSDYSLLKFKGEPMWGTTVFEEAQLAVDRRSFRSARRRLDRRQQRVDLTREIFAKEIAKVDDKFYIRLNESSLFREDTKYKDRFAYFNDENYTDIDYHKQYPTVHHLITELMNNTEPHDVRLVYIAVAWLIAHRGHFLNEVEKNNIDKVLDFGIVYENLMMWFETAPWSCEANEFAEIMKIKTGVSKKEKLFFDLLFAGKKPKLNPETDTFDKALIIKLLSGGKVSPEKLFLNEGYADVPSFSLATDEDTFATILVQLDEDAELIEKLRAVYDWALLTDILAGKNSVSEAKVAVYEQHKSDLKQLKAFVKKYLPKKKYYKIFKNNEKTNYVAYSYNEKSLKVGERCEKKASKEVFCDYLKKELKGITPDEADAAFYEDMMQRLETYSFMPKQVNGDNRVIPYQLYWYELNKILKNAEVYLPFLAEKDDEGISNSEKLLSVFEFRVPYYVGPLRTDNSHFSWMKRKKEGKIYPWNFSDVVDLDKSEESFINKLTNKCTYLRGEDVLPKNSILYCKFSILNEINNIKINDVPISVEAKMGIFSLFEKSGKVTVKKIKAYLESEGLFKDGDTLSGIDISVKSNYKPYHDFRRLIADSILTIDQAEDVIARLTYCEDKSRIRKYLKKNYPNLSADDINYISKLKYNDFGRLSKKLLTGITGIRVETGELLTVIEALEITNDNLMQIIASDKYTFKDVIEEHNSEYYSEHPQNLESLLDEMYISNSVRRPIYRTIDIVKDIRKTMGHDPKKIFIEMARGATEDQKGKRTVSRREQIKELYKNADSNEINRLMDELEHVDDRSLQSRAIFLYFLQLGKCMYTGKSLDLSKLKSEENIEHIYPQSKVKDDSFDNIILVTSEANGAKGDSYPVPAEWQNRMMSYWKMLNKAKLISDEKFKRLTRRTPFTDSEKEGFINRQLVETRQSTKAIATILGNMFKDTEIVYVKAGLVSDFRHEFDILKSRQVNDLHHAKDAYLNIVCGNVYNCKFTKKYITANANYSIKTRTVYTNPVKLGNTVIWEGESSLAKVKKIVSKDNIHFTRYAFMRKGGFFGQMPVKASKGLVERKKGLDTEKYGGYNKTTATCFMLARYVIKGKPEIMFVPIELLYASKIFADESYAVEYVRKAIATIENKPVEAINELSFPLGMRKIKINTVISTDGYRCYLRGKEIGGSYIALSSMTPLKLCTDLEYYIKKLETVSEKLAKNPNYKAEEKYDKISKEKNLELYELFTEKLTKKPFSLAAFANQYELLEKCKSKFEDLTVEKQVTALLNILLLFKTGRAGACDFSGIGGGSSVGSNRLNSKLSNWAKKYSDVRIIDVSASGLHEKSSQNLLELL